MNFVNNWIRPIVLSESAESAELDLPDGDYILTLSDSAQSPTRWEVVQVYVVSGTAQIYRGQPKDWPEGSVIYCSITAEHLAFIEETLKTIPPPPMRQFSPVMHIFDGDNYSAFLQPGNSINFQGPGNITTNAALNGRDFTAEESCYAEVKAVQGGGFLLIVTPVTTYI